MGKKLDMFLDGDDEQKPELKPVEKKPEPKSDISNKELSRIVESLFEKKIDELLVKCADAQAKEKEIVIEESLVKALNAVVDHHVKSPKLIDGLVEEIKKMINVNIQRHMVEIPALNIEYVSEHPLHHQFDEVMATLLGGCNIYLYGDAGCGKTQLAEDIAKALGINLYILNANDSIGIYGFTDINGVFQHTSFTRFVNDRNPKVALLYISELDSYDQVAITQMNTAFANKICVINNETVRLSDKHYIICDGNTSGNGASFVYSTRKRMDAATIDRFAFISLDYDRNIEMFVSDNNQELCDFIDRFRQITKEADIQCLATYRAIINISKFEEMFGIEKVLNMFLLKNLDIDDLVSVQKRIDCQNNKYCEAFKLIKY